MDFIFANQEFILGLVSALVVWIISRTTGTLIDKAKVNSALAIILDIIQDIKINLPPRTWTTMPRSNWQSSVLPRASPVTRPIWS